MTSMNFHNNGSKKNTPTTNTAESAPLQSLTDQPGYPRGMIVNQFFSAIDRTTKVQAPVVEKYVDRLRKKHHTKTNQELQRVLDKQLLRATTLSGAGNGALAAFPGVGTLISAGVVGGEAVVVLEVCALYALASAHLRGIDIHAQEEREAIVLLTVAGSSGKDVIAALGQAQGVKGALSLRSLGTLTKRQLTDINSTLGRLAFRQMRKKFGDAMVQKLLPFGVGAFLGGRANRKIARQMIKQTQVTLGPID